MMRAARKLAAALVSVAVRHSPLESRCWGEAMLRELDFVEGDRAALLWAAGSLTALLRHSALHQLKTAFEKVAGPAQGPRSNAKKITEVLLGVGIAGALLVVGVCCLWRRMVVLLPQSQGERATVAVIALVEVAYLRGAIALWRQRRALAMGILLAGIALTVHVAMHS